MKLLALIFFIQLHTEVKAQTLHHIVLEGPTKVAVNKPVAFTVKFRDSQDNEVPIPSTGQSFWDIEDGFVDTPSKSFCVAQFTAVSLQGYIQVQFSNNGQLYTSDLYVEVVNENLPFPSQINLSDITYSSFRVSWSPASTALLDVSPVSNFALFTGFYYQVNASGTFTFTENLYPAKTYWVRLSVVGTTGATASTVLTVTVGDAPKAVFATSFTQTRFKANWFYYPGATGYEIDVSEQNDFSSFVNGYSSMSVGLSSGAVISGLTAGTMYYYRIRAVTETGTSPNSNIISTYTLPSIPEITGATNITSNSFIANWTTVAGATHYELDVATDKDFNSLVNGYNDLTVNGSNRAVTGLASGEQYYYRVRAANLSGSTLNSESAELITTSSSLPVPEATAATALTSYSFVANWNPQPGADGYLLEVATDNAFEFKLNGYNLLPVEATSRFITRLVPGQEYFYRVRSVHGAETSVSSNEVSLVLVPPPPVATKASDLLSTSFTANWKSARGANHYLLDVSTQADFSSFVGIYENHMVAGTSVQVSGLNEHTKYFYRLRSENESGKSVYSNIVEALDLDENYIQSVDIQVANVKDIYQVNDENKLMTTNFFDGLGRPVQTINWRASPNAKDIVQVITYDIQGRQSIQYLPYVAADDSGWYKPAFVNKDDPSYVLSPQYKFYQSEAKVAHDTKPYSETVFEASPLNRALKQGAPGEVWQPDADPLSTTDRTIKYRYESNGTNEVLNFTYDPSAGVVDARENGSLRFYDPNELYAHKTIDEHGNETIEYTDKEGKTVLKKVQYAEENGFKLYAETYYIYDDFGNLVVVLPPEAVKEFLTSQY